MSLAIKVENLSKAYQIGEFSTGTISRDLERWWANLRGKDDPFLKIGETNDRNKKGKGDIVWSLKDLDFEIEQGDAVGIIGKNGAGKSTLLKLLSRVTSPTTGSIKVKGRIASLLEVGTGFHPELTGRENIFINGAILGLRKKEIKKRFDEIVDFAGVERYIDTPVKRYSSGMYVRLAFAVAAHLESEILIVDEVLAVGDAEFQKKCLGKMSDVSKGEGRTVLFVSHNMAAVEQLCSTGIILNEGKISIHDKISVCIRHYLTDTFKTHAKSWENKNLKNTPLEIIKASILTDKIADENQLLIQFQIHGKSDIKSAFVAFDVRNSLGISIMQAIPIENPFISIKNKYLEFESQISVQGLIPDTYSISIWIGPFYTITYDWQKDILQFDIINSPIKGRTHPHAQHNGFFVPQSSIRQLS